MKDQKTLVARRTPAIRGALPGATALCLGVSALASLALAADDARSGRFTMTPADGGFIRLDTETGALALCAKNGDQWACQPMPDSQQSQAREIERLQAENKALKDEIRRMEDVMGLGEPKPGEPPVAGGERPKGGLELPSEKDVDKAFDYVQRMLKKFQERMRELESGQGGGSGKGTPL